jgi:hypothetical protein
MEAWPYGEASWRHMSDINISPLVKKLLRGIMLSSHFEEEYLAA